VAYEALLGNISVEDRSPDQSYQYTIGKKWFTDNFSLGNDRHDTNDRTKNGFTILSGNKNFGDCTGPVNKSLLRLYQAATDAGGVAWIFFKVNQLYSSGYSRSAAGTLIGSSTRGTNVVALTPSLTVVIPTDTGVGLTIAAFTENEGSGTVDMGLTITATGAGAVANDICVEWMAIVSGNVTEL
jgi:hypothetical protein